MLMIHMQQNVREIVGCCADSFSAFCLVEGTQFDEDRCDNIKIEDHNTYSRPDEFSPHRSGHPSKSQKTPITNIKNFLFL